MEHSVKPPLRARGTPVKQAKQAECQGDVVRLTERQLDALISALDGHSRAYAGFCLAELEAAFAAVLPFGWCSLCCSYRRGDHRHESSGKRHENVKVCRSEEEFHEILHSRHVFDQGDARGGAPDRGVEAADADPDGARAVPEDVPGPPGVPEEVEEAEEPLPVQMSLL